MARLTEEDVHVACGDIVEQGEKPTALKLLDSLGKGSLTTISKYLTTWSVTDEAQAADVESLPAVVALPEQLTQDGEDLLKKIWNVAKSISDADIEIQREALKQAEATNQAKVEEAFAFSEAQSKKNDRLEEEISSLKIGITKEKEAHDVATQALNEAEKINVGLTKDLDQSNEKNVELAALVADLEAKNKLIEQSILELKEQQSKDISGKDKEIKLFDIQVHKLQSSLDSAVRTKDGLRSDIKDMSVELKGSVAEAVKLAAFYENAGKQIKALESDIKAVKSDAEAELVEVKKELKLAQNDAVSSGKEVARLEGKLEVYALKEKESIKK